LLAVVVLVLMCIDPPVRWHVFLRLLFTRAASSSANPPWRIPGVPFEPDQPKTDDPVVLKKNPELAPAVPAQRQCAHREWARYAKHVQAGFNAKVSDVCNLTPMREFSGNAAAAPLIGWYAKHVQAL
jgi:hypothetical protein